MENTHGLLRSYLRKRSWFADVTQERLDEIAELLKNRFNEAHFNTKSLRTLRKRCTSILNAPANMKQKIIA